MARPLRAAMLATLPIVAGLPSAGAQGPVTAGIHMGIACSLESPLHTGSAAGASRDLAATDLEIQAHPNHSGGRS
jgi:hypothetical protein